ncbi:MAG: RNA polymerase sigma factor [Crocinitomicaceae bacterium]|nr:RNA polymerase sigma factor [Crocinitomicaceae bacterium]
MEEVQVKEHINQIISGDTREYSILVEQYKGMVYSICFKIIGNQELAEEAAQDTFVKAFKSLNKFRGNSKFSTWLYQIAYFTSINAARKGKKESVDLQEVYLSENKNELETDERKVLLHQAINQLKPEEKAIITLYYLKELSLEEVAVVARLSLSNVKVKVHRIKKKLGSILENMLNEEIKELKYE